MEKALDLFPGEVRPHNEPQRSPGWFAARRGKPTASQFSRLCREDGSARMEGWEAYSDELAADFISPTFPRWKGNADTRRGEDLEPIAAQRFSDWHLSASLTLVSAPFYTRGGAIGASPDGLIINDDREAVSGWEVKAPRPAKQLETMRNGGIPEEHLAQIHGGMIVTGIPKWVFVSVCPGFDMYSETVRPDEYTRNLAETLERFAKFHGGRLAELEKVARPRGERFAFPDYVPSRL